MNGVNEPDYGSRSVYENAERAARSLLERAVRHEDLRQPNPEWDADSEVYARRTGRVEQYMIAGGGPTEWVCFVFTRDGDLDHAYLRYVSAGEPALIHFGQFDGEDLYTAMKSYSR